MAGTEGTEGQAAKVESKGTTTAAPQRTEGQSAPQGQTTQAGTAKQKTATGPDSGQVESFFDPESIKGKPELESAYKQMQSKWTKAMQKAKEGSKKAEAYDQILSNPLAAVQKYAQQNGYQLVQRDPKANAEDEAPKTWDDVYARAKQEVLKELQPVLGEVKQLKIQNVEQYLDNNHTDWRTYEDDMLKTLQAHPTLANDPDSLYRLSVPIEVWEARATRTALAKLKGESEAGQISGAGTTRGQPTEPQKAGIKSFNDAVAYAKASIARQGIRPLGG